MLDESQGGHLSINPLQTKSLIPFYKSSYAHNACPLQKSRMEMVQGRALHIWKFGKRNRFQKPLCPAVRLQCCYLAFKYQLPSRWSAVLLPMERVSPPFNKEMLNDCCSLIGNCRIQRISDFTSQLTRKSDSPYTLML